MSARAPIPEPKWKQDKNIDDIIPSELDQATGLERAEMLAEMEGKQLFDVQVRFDSGNGCCWRCSSSFM